MVEHGLGIDVKIGTGNSYHHEVLTCLVTASMEISCPLEFVHWQDLLTFKKVPATTKTSATPFSIPLVHLDRKHLRPDGAPFCLRDARPLCFLDVETDMSTEVLAGTPSGGNSRAI